VADSILRLGIDSSGMRTGAEQGVRSLDSIQSAAGVVVRQLTAVGAAYLSVSKIISAGREAELNTLRLANTIKNLGDKTNLTVEFVGKLSERLSKLSGFDDDNIVKASQTLAGLGFTSRETQARVLELAVNLERATGKFGGVEEAARSVARALLDPGNNMRMLTMAGVALNDAQVEAAKSAVALGDKAKGVDIILTGLEEKTRGGAEAYMKAVGGSDSFATSLDNLAEQLAKTFKVTEGGNIILTRASQGVDGLSKMFAALEPIVSGVLDRMQAGLIQVYGGMLRVNAVIQAMTDSNLTMADAIKQADAQTQSIYKSFLSEIEAQHKLENQKEKTVEAVKDEASASKTLTEAQKQLQEQMKQLNKTGTQRISDLKFENEWLQKQIAATREGTAALEEYQVQYAVAAEMRKDYVKALGPNEVKALEEATKANTELNNELDKLQNLTDPVADAMKRAAENIQDAFSQTFENIFDKGVKGFDGFSDMVLSIMKKTAAQVAALFVFQQLGFGGLLSGASGSGGISMGGGPGGGGLGGLSSLSSLSGLFSGGGLFSSTLSDIGIDAAMGLGFKGSGVVAASGAFGNLGYGALGGLGASLLGLGSKNPVANMLGGTGGALIGGGIGASLGTILGMAGGPVGAVAGGFLGTALSGLFGGGGRTNSGVGTTIDLTTLARSQVNTGKGNSATIGALENNLQIIQQAIPALTQLLGAAPRAGSAIGVETGSFRGTQITYGNGAGGNFTGSYGSADPNAAADFLYKNINLIFGQLDADIQKIVSSAKDLNDIIKKLTDDQTRRTLNASIQDQINQLVDPQKYALDQLAKQYEQLKETATSVGADLVNLEKLYGLQRKQIIDQYSGGANSSLRDYLNKQLLGSSSSLGLSSKLPEAQKQFNDLFQSALGGDRSALSGITSAADTVLSLGQQYYASGSGYAALESTIRGSLEQLGSSLNLTGFGDSTVSAINAASNAEIASLAELKAQMERLVQLFERAKDMERFT